MTEQLLSSTVFSMDNLFAGDFPRIPKEITLLSGENRTRGALLGKITKSAPTTGTAGGTNTGNGTVTAVAMGKYAKLGTYSLECKEAPVTSKTVPSTGTAGTNTGNGTMTGVSGGSAVKAGTYVLTCIAAATDSGTFRVIDPDGVRLKDATVAVAYTSNHLNFTINDGTTDFAVNDSFTVAVTAVGNSGKFTVTDPDGNVLNDATVAVAYASNQLNFTINDGSTDFVIGDTFTVAVAAGSGKYKLSLAASVDGSQDLETAVVLAKDTDASSADVKTIGYTSGEFNENYMTFGTGHTAASAKAAFETMCKSIFLKTPVKA